MRGLYGKTGKVIRLRNSPLGYGYLKIVITTKLSPDLYIRGHRVFYGVESWSGVMEWSIDVEWSHILEWQKFLLHLQIQFI